MSEIIFYEETSNDEAQKDSEDTFWDIYHFQWWLCIENDKDNKKPHLSLFRTTLL